MALAPDCVCVVCHARFLASTVGVCPECQGCVCPACGAHEQIALMGVFAVPPQHAASVRASVWGRGN